MAEKKKISTITTPGGREGGNEKEDNGEMGETDKRKRRNEISIKIRRLKENCKRH